MVLSDAERRLLDEARRAVLATIRRNGRPRLVPIAFAAVLSEHDAIIYSALDEKPKTVVDPRRLGRVRDIIARPQVSMLVDRWSEDWTRLAWLRLDGTAELIEPGAGAHAHFAAVELLRARYAQYAGQRLEERPLLRIHVETSASWGLDR